MKTLKLYDRDGLLEEISMCGNQVQRNSEVVIDAMINRYQKVHNDSFSFALARLYVADGDDYRALEYRNGYYILGKYV